MSNRLLGALSSDCSRIIAAIARAVGSSGSSIAKSGLLSEQ